MAAYSRKKFARALVRMLPKHSVADVAKAAAPEIISQHWVRELDAILADVSAELMTTQNHLEARVASAHLISSALRKSITTFLQSRYQAETVSLTETIDPSLLGGLVITTPREEIDASIKNKLSILKHHT